MVKFWMDRDQIVGPIDAYLKERSERMSEIDAAKTKMQEALIRFYEHEPYYYSYPMSAPYAYCTTLRDSEKLRESAMAAHDGKVLCDHSTFMFLNSLSVAVDDEILTYTKCTEGCENHIKFLKTHKPVVPVVPEPPEERQIEATETPGTGPIAFMIVSGFITVSFLILQKAFGA